LKKIIVLFLLVSPFLSTLTYSQFTPVKPEFTQPVKNENYQSVKILGQQGNLTFAIIYYFEGKYGEVKNKNLVCFENGVIINSKPFQLPKLPSGTSKNLSLYLNFSEIVKGKLFYVIRGLDNGDEKVKGDETVSFYLCNIDLETLLPIEENLTFLCEYKSNFTSNDVIYHRIYLNSDSTCLSVTQLEAKNTFKGLNPTMGPMKISYDVYEIESLELIKKGELESQLTGEQYYLSNFQLIKKSNVVITFDSGIEEVSVSLFKIKKNDHKLPDQVVFYGQVGSSDLLKKEFNFFKSKREHLTQYIKMEDGNLISLRIFRDSTFRDDKFRAYIPGLELDVINPIDMSVIKSFTVKATPLQTSLLYPNDKDPFSKSMVSLQEIKTKSFYTNIQTSKDGRLIVSLDFQYVVGTLNVKGAILVASFDLRDTDNSWLRVVPKYSTGYNLGINTFVKVANEDVYVVSSDDKSNIENINAIDEIINNGHTAGTEVPEKSSFKMIAYNLRSKKNILRIDKIDKGGMVKHYSINDFPGGIDYFTNPSISTTWIDDNSVLYVSGFYYEGHLDLINEGKYKKFDHIVVDLEKLGSE